MDKSASTIAKLKNKAKITGRPFALHLQLFCQEEFLRKIALSKYSKNLILKGGLFIYTLSNFESRSTIDVDFLLKDLPNNIEQIQKIIQEIINVDTGNNFVTFETSGYERITPERKYNGISFKLIGKIKNTKTPFFVDVGVGDIVVPKSELRQIPTQLKDFISPNILTYSLESTISEKLDAIIQRLEMTSRMKDFFDIYYISSTFNFEGKKLKQAIVETLENRGTSYNEETFNRIISLAKNKDMIVKWNNFVKKLELKQISFEEIIKILNDFLNSIWDAIITRQEFLKFWNCENMVWENM